ncbi:MAG: TRAP transporter substrate-binding protein DctP, partial [Alphaproteobacteria bacterium]
MSRVSVAAFAATSILCFLPSGSIAQEITLTALNFLPNNSGMGSTFAEWVSDVNKAGKGIVQIQIRPAGSISPFQMANAVKAGVVDMGAVPPAFYQNLLPIADALKLARRSPEEMRKNGTWAFMNNLHNEKVNAWLLNTTAYSVKFYLYLR